MFSMRIFHFQKEGHDDLDENWQMNLFCERAYGYNTDKALVYGYNICLSSRIS